jgi:hypothetical protein
MKNICITQKKMIQKYFCLMVAAFLLCLCALSVDGVNIASAVNLAQNSDDVQRVLEEYDTTNTITSIPFVDSDILHKMDSKAALPLLGFIILGLFFAGIFYVLYDYSITKKVVHRSFHTARRTSQHMSPLQKR